MLDGDCKRELGLVRDIPFRGVETRIIGNQEREVAVPGMEVIDYVGHSTRHAAPRHTVTQTPDSTYTKLDPNQISGYYEN